jgi:hypothetical protein
MQEDMIDEVFAALEEYYPGSKRKRRKVELPEAKVIEPKSWDSKPYYKTMPNGTDMEMFTLGSLADALGRPIVTLRHWMKMGYLPQSPYRLPSKPNKNGDIQKGRRLYSRAMIEYAVEVFDQTGLFDVERIEWSNYQQVITDIAEMWSQLRIQEIEN